MHALKPNRESEEDDEAFLRRLIFPEEDRHLFTTAPWRGGYRWFRAEADNVVCLEKARRLRSQD
jgi:hypothetical protein